MSQLYFNYSTMNAGKSTALLQVNHNYKERSMTTMLFTFAGDDRYQVGKITSRIGLEADAFTFTGDTDMLATCDYHLEHCLDKAPDCILIDEAQFLTEDQVQQLCAIVDDYDIPVMCYGLRNDFQGKLFPGSAALFASADKLQEMKTICHCGHKATHVLRLDSEGKAVYSGNQVQIGGNDTYVSVCRKHYNLGFVQ